MVTTQELLTGRNAYLPTEDERIKPEDRSNITTQQCINDINTNSVQNESNPYLQFKNIYILKNNTIISVHLKLEEMNTYIWTT